MLCVQLLPSLLLQVRHSTQTHAHTYSNMHIHTRTHVAVCKSHRKHALSDAVSFVLVATDKVCVSPLIAKFPGNGHALNSGAECQAKCAQISLCTHAAWWDGVPKKECRLFRGCGAMRGLWDHPSHNKLFKKSGPMQATQGDHRVTFVFDPPCGHCFCLCVVRAGVSYSLICTTQPQLTELIALIRLRLRGQTLQTCLRRSQQQARQANLRQLVPRSVPRFLGLATRQM